MVPIEVGLVGTGPWARLVHGPVLAAGPETRLTGIWGRRPEAAGDLAGQLGVTAFERYEDLLEVSQAIAFAVPPAVQAELALQAAGHGKALLLEKPIADDLAGARRLVEAIDDAGVVTQLALSWRYSAAVRDFLRQAADFDALGGQGTFMSGGMLAGPFVTPWRLDRGALLDLGPHMIDLLDAALGTVVDIRAHGDSRGWLGLLLEHSGGRVSEASICAVTAVNPHQAEVTIYGKAGALRADCATAVDENTFATMRREFAHAVSSGTAHPLDVHRGLHLQQLIASAEAQLTTMK